MFSQSKRAANCFVFIWVVHLWTSIEESYAGVHFCIGVYHVTWLFLPWPMAMALYFIFYFLVQVFLAFSIFIWLKFCNQGINILLTADEHCIGRLVEDVRFQIDSNSVSANHCRIYRTKITNENMENTTSIFLKDTRLWLRYRALVPSSFLLLERGRKECFF